MIRDWMGMGIGRVECDWWIVWRWIMMLHCDRVLGFNDDDVVLHIL